MERQLLNGYVVNPISNYCLIPYIGKYVNFSEVYKGEKGNLDVNYWVLDYNLEKAKNYMPDQVHKMLRLHLNIGLGLILFMRTAIN